jgi:hypothetical protein
VDGLGEPLAGSIWCGRGGRGRGRR